jgi:PTS system beta-glucosides-specific IIC component
VGLKGKGFTPHVKMGDRVKRGDLLLEVDLALIRKEGLSTVTPVVISNSDDFAEILPRSAGHTEPGAEIIELKK